MIEFNLSEAQSFQFEMKIDGKIKTVDSVHLVIESGDGYDIKLPAKYDNSNHIVECEIPVLSGVLSEGEKTIKLELVVDGKFYTPLQEQILVESPVKIEAKPVEESVKTVEDSKPVAVSLGKLIRKDAMKK